MKLLFDLEAAQPIGDIKFHGGGVYTRILFKNLAERFDEKKDKEIICFYRKDKTLAKEILDIIDRKNIKLLEIGNKKEIEKIVFEMGVDRVYSALPYQLFGLDLKDIEFIFTIHGLRFIEFPTDKYEIVYSRNLIDLGKYLFKNLFRGYYIKTKKKEIEKVLNISRKFKIIVPSYYTKYSLLQNFPYLKNRTIHVLYSPCSDNTSSIKKSNLRKFGITAKNYFLIVGAGRWIKNSYRAIIALDQLFSTFPKIDKRVLVLGNRRANFFKKLSNPSRFVFCGNVEREEMELLYKNAYCLIYPTLNEGFGYPPLESIKYGTPVLGSAVSSITEIYKDNILYFNPFSIHSIKNRILQLISDPILYKEYSQKGLLISSTIRKKQNRDMNKLIDILLE